MRYFLFILISIICFQAKAQDDYSVSNIKLSYDKVSGEVNITYDLLPTNTNAQFKIVPEFYYSNGQKIFASSFTGEGIETFTKCGNGKIIRWKPAQDKIRLNEDIYVVLNVNREIRISTGSHLLKSAILPGWGDYKLSNSWYYAGFGIVAYGAVSGAILYNRMAANTYDNYKNSMDISQSNKLLSDAKNQQKISNVLAISSAAIWAIDLARVYIKSQKVKKEIKSSNYYFDQSNQSFSNRSGNFWLDNRTPFDIALQEGDKAFKSGSFNEAQLKYKSALGIDPGNSIAQMKLDETNRILAERKAKEDKYNSLVFIGDSLFKAKDYISAKTKYNEALSLIPVKVYPQQQLNEIAKIQERERKYEEYKEVITNANNSFNQKNYEEAKLLYQKALTILNNEPYPTNKIQECDDIINDNKYSIAIKNGDKFYNAKDFVLAKEYYEQALSIKNNDPIALTKLNSAKQKLSEIEQARIDLEYSALIKEAKIALSKDEYQKAKSAFQQALLLKPYESFPKIKIDEIDKLYQSDNMNMDSKKVLELTKDAVFFLYAETYSYFNTESGTGTGFFITPDGIAISNYHVYSKGKYGEVYTGDYLGKNESVDKSKLFEIEKVIAESEEKDYVIFQVKKKYKGQTFPYIKIANKSPEVLDKVLAIGNPEGNFLRMPSQGDVKQLYSDDYYIITDVDVTFGNSGGPLINMKGEVVGIMTMVIDEGRKGLNFAINIQKIPGISKYK